MAMQIKTTELIVINRHGDCVWHWRIQREHFPWPTQSLVTGTDGKGLFLLDPDDEPSFMYPDWDFRMERVAADDDFEVSLTAANAQAEEEFTIWLRAHGCLLRSRASS